MSNLKQLSRRREEAWKKNMAWQKLYDEAYAYAVPNRRPARGRHGKVEGQTRGVEIFDATATEMVYQSAAQLRDDIAPPGAPLARLGLNRLARRKLIELRGNDTVDQLMSIHADLSDAANLCFSGRTGFPTALLEVCLDAHAGTGALLALEGDIEAPVKWAAIPQDELALEMDMFGHDQLICWKQESTKSIIQSAFPKAKYSEDFLKDWEKTSEDKCEIEQVWEKFEHGWRFYVFIENKNQKEEHQPLLTEVLLSCPVITMHYNRVPGEERGRGPILNALAAIKTANRVMEFQLKAAAIDLLGIWLYNPHEINPDSLKLEPGALWPGSTGGIMGEAVKRLDTRGDRSDIAANLMQDLRSQISNAFQRSPLPVDGQTPRSATEFMVRDKENIRRYRGAYGRMVEDFIPRVFWRAVQIVQKVWLIHPNVKLDQVMTQLDVLSPLAVSMRLQSYQHVIEYMQVAAQISAMPEGTDLYIEREELLNDMGYDAGIRPEYLVNAEERKAKIQLKMAGMAAMATAQAQAAAPKLEPPPPGTPA